MNYADAFQHISESREQGKFDEALKLISTVLLAALQEKQYQYVVATGMEKAAVFRHLFVSTGQQEYLQFAWSSLLEVEPWSEQNKPAFIFWQAQVLLSQREYSKAERKYRQVLTLTPEESPTFGNYLVHYGVAVFLNGIDLSVVRQTEKGLDRLNAGIDILQANEANIDSYTHDVWLSGAYLRKAQLLAIVGRREEAHSSLEQARAIIENGEELVLRKEHLRKTEAFLAEEFPQMETLF